MKDSLSAFLANLGSLIFKIFWHVAPHHGGASFVTNLHPPFSKFLYLPLIGKVYVSSILPSTRTFFNIGQINEVIKEVWHKNNSIFIDHLNMNQ